MSKGRRKRKPNYQNREPASEHSQPDQGQNQPYVLPVDFPNPLPVKLETTIGLPLAIERYYASEQSERRSNKNREIAKVWVEGLGLLVAAMLLVLTLETLKSARAANSLSMRSIQTAIESERPWMGISLNIQNWEVGKTSSAIVFFMNSGRRPAKLTLARFDSRNYASFPNAPDYGSGPVSSSALILPQANLTNTRNLGPVTEQRLKELASKKTTLFIYASIEYEDPVTRAKHWTHAWWQYLPGFQNSLSGFVNCSEYNEIDED